MDLGKQTIPLVLIKQSEEIANTHLQIWVSLESEWPDSLLFGKDAAELAQEMRKTFGVPFKETMEFLETLFAMETKEPILFYLVRSSCFEIHEEGEDD